ncbi:MAG: substrate-binding domain-containing protein [Anaerolineae bacterium]|nr:substrate-binding domain-containing protein [Anaerolineae bacterium]NUQ06357.1 substrate-binding domain-containing protein [Anaerolineae bacterium]
MKTRILIFSLLVMAFFGLSVSAVMAQDGLSFCYVIHSDPAGSFWNVATAGAQAAAAQVGADLTAVGSLDPVQQAQFIEDCIAQGVDGLAVSLANPDALRDAVGHAVEAGIPVVTLNSGVDVFRELGAITHVGQTEFVAGQGSGLRFNDMGVSHVLCVIHEEGNIGLEQRCDGVADSFSGTVDRFNVASTGVNDLAGTTSTIQDKLTADSSIDAIITLNPDVGVAARDAIAAAGSSQVLATFDLSPTILQAIVDGQVAFAIDQQQYLQGYLPIIFLNLYNVNANTVGGGLPVLTGPGFVDASNAASVIALSAAGTR